MTLNTMLFFFFLAVVLFCAYALCERSNSFTKPMYAWPTYLVCAQAASGGGFPALVRSRASPNHHPSPLIGGGNGLGVAS